MDAAEHRGLGVMCSGTHPMTEWAGQPVSPSERYDKLMDQMQWMARRLQIFGVHVHVGVRSPEKAIPIVNALTSYVPHFLALSASSPFWRGADTGLASARSKIFEGLPTAGLPVQLADWDEFEQLMGTLVASGTIETIREVWWDIRPHPGFGTVELRICDGLPTLQEVGAVAALAQCLVDQLNTQLDRGYQLPRPHTWVAAGEQVAGGAARALGRADHRRARRDASAAGGRSPNSCTTCARSRSGSAAPANSTTCS